MALEAGAARTQLGDNRAVGALPVGPAHHVSTIGGVSTLSLETSPTAILTRVGPSSMGTLGDEFPETIAPTLASPSHPGDMRKTLVIDILDALGVVGS